MYSGTGQKWQLAPEPPYFWLGLDAEMHEPEIEDDGWITLYPNIWGGL